MILKFHKSLTAEKWVAYPIYKQILMISTELCRADSWIKKNDYNEVKLCYERAFELLYLTIAVIKEKNKRKELLRFWEILAGLYIKGNATIEENSALNKILISLDKDSFNLLKLE